MVAEFERAGHALSHFPDAGGSLNRLHVLSIISLRASLWELPRCCSIAIIQSCLEIKPLAVFSSCISNRLRSNLFAQISQYIELACPGSIAEQSRRTMWQALRKATIRSRDLSRRSACFS